MRRAIRDLDDRHNRGRLRAWWNRNAVLGGGWGEFLDACVDVAPGALVVDVGAGEAMLRERMPAGVRYLALDRGIGHGGWDYSALDAVADAQQLPVANESADLVICKQVLEHLPEPVAALREIARILTPGGRLLLSTNQQWPQHQAPHDYFRFTSFGLRYCCQQAGLTVERLDPMGGVFTTALFHATQMAGPHLYARTPRAHRIATVVLKPVGWLARLLTPLATLLDRLDRSKDNTLGYYLSARRREGSAGP